jgi:hypothetical protein
METGSSYVRHKRSLSRGSSDLPELWKCGNLACVIHLASLHSPPPLEGCLRRDKERGNSECRKQERILSWSLGLSAGEASLRAGLVDSSMEAAPRQKFWQDTSVESKTPTGISGSTR